MSTATFAAPLGGPRFTALGTGGVPLSGGKVYIYQAGTSTPDSSYPTYNDALAGTNANSNPVVLDSNGQATIFLQSGRLYKIVCQDSSGVTFWTTDNTSPAYSYPSSQVVSQWVKHQGPAPGYFATYATLTSASFNITENLNPVDTQNFEIGRRVRVIANGNEVVGTVKALNNASGSTGCAVTLVLDNGMPSIADPISAVYYSVLTVGSYGAPTAASYLDPRTALSVSKSGNQTAFATQTKVTTWTVDQDALSEWSAANNNWVCKYPGKYLITASARFSDTAANVTTFLEIVKNGTTTVASAVGQSPPTASNNTTINCCHVVNLVDGDTLDFRFTGSANTSVVGGNATALTITRVP